MKIFGEIMDEEPFDTDEQETQWWQQLPSVPAVTGVLLRQQTRRRWKPTALTQMFARLPRLQALHYEPWREWCCMQQKFTDRCGCSYSCSSPVIYALTNHIAFQSLFESLASSQLWELVLFENFSQQYPLSFTSRWVRDPVRIGCDPIRIPSSDLTRVIASASRKLEHLSASFIVDASYFFSCELSWEWSRLTSLALTSLLLAPNTRTAKVDNMLLAAAEAVMKMPNLEVMEIWNGREDLAMLFRYQLNAGGGQPAIITWRGIWEFALRPAVVQAWEAVSLKRHGHGIVLSEELLGGVTIKSHADAIYHLSLLNQVIRPISLRQIRMEHRVRDGQDWHLD